MPVACADSASRLAKALLEQCCCSSNARPPCAFHQLSSIGLFFSICGVFFFTGGCESVFLSIVDHLPPQRLQYIQIAAFYRATTRGFPIVEESVRTCHHSRTPGSSSQIWMDVATSPWSAHLTGTGCADAYQQRSHMSFAIPCSQRSQINHAGG